MNYLIIVLITLVAFVTADKEWKPITSDTVHLRIRADCIRESRLTQAQVDKLPHIELLNENEFDGYFLCNVKKLGLFTEEEGYNVDRVIAYIEALHETTGNTRSAVEKCGNSTEQNIKPSVRAFRGVMCFLRNNGILKK